MRYKAFGNKYNLGRKLTPEHKEKIRLGNLGKKVSEESRKRISLSRRGAKSHFWRGGISTENEKFRRSADYRIWREAVFKRDDYTCILCGIRGGQLNADHIKPFAFYPELRLAIDNGRTLCIICHRRTETWGKRNL